MYVLDIQVYHKHPELEQVFYTAATGMITTRKTIEWQEKIPG